MSGPPAGWEGWLAVCGLKREAAIWGGRAVVGGGRSDALALRLEAAIAGERPRGLISFGVAGGLLDSLEIGHVIAAESVVTQAGERWGCDALARARLPGSAGVVVGGDTVLSSPQEKAAHQNLGTLVDMESHVAARAAAHHALPLAVLRVVSDAAGHALPPAAIAGMGPDGDIDVWAVIAGLARDPRQLPALLRMGRDSGIAFGRLDAARREMVSRQ